MAVEEAGDFSSDLTPSLGTSICYMCSTEKIKKKCVVNHKAIGFTTQKSITDNPSLSLLLLIVHYKDDIKIEI